MGTKVDIKSKTTSMIKVRKPRQFKVIFLNDDFTPFMFVERVLIVIFNKTKEEAMQIAQEVHDEGKAVVGVYPKEIAETKQAQTLYNAQQNDFPLSCLIEPDEEE